MNASDRPVRVHPHGASYTLRLPDLPIAYLAPHPSGRGALIAYKADRSDRDDCFVVLAVSESIAALRWLVPGAMHIPIRPRAWSEVVKGDEAAAMRARFRWAGCEGGQ